MSDRNLRENQSDKGGSARAANRLPMVHTLRGVAAVAVVIAHFFYANANVNTGILHPIARFGMLGVQIFFVISGFVLPYSLWHSGYIRSDFGTFVWKRVMRLDPPYFAAIAIGLIAAFLATRFPGYRGKPISVSPVQLLLHFAYLNAFFDRPWIIPVFWTLAIEFQYYLTLGLVFPLLTSGKRAMFPLFVALCVLSQWAVPGKAFLPLYWPLFLLGIAVFRYKARIAGSLETAAWLSAFFAWGYFRTGNDGAMAGLLCALSILFLRYSSRITDFLGTISYSLYLIHEPIGNRIVNLGSRWATNPAASALVSTLATVSSVACAYCMWRWIELPSQRWAGRIRYAHRTTSSSGAAPDLNSARMQLTRELP